MDFFTKKGHPIHPVLIPITYISVEGDEMKQIHRLIRVADLIAKYICNQINPSEKEDLNAWKNESAKNENLFDKIIDWDNFQNRNQTYKSFDAEQAWEQFSTEIYKPKNRFRIMTFIRYAAAIMIPLLIVGSVLFYFIGNQDDTRREIASINPGTQNAIIVLDNGENINLEDEKLNQLVEKDGSVIRNEKGQLSYLDVKSERRKKLLQNSLIVPRGGEYKLILSDGSVVYVNSVSKLTYPVTFSKSKREVTLEGEAYFEIERDENRPFFVNINGMKIEVLGTSFNVKAYSDEDEIYTTLVEGKIKLNTIKSNDEWILTPEQQAVLEKNSNKVMVRNVDVQQFVGWKNGVYSFTDQSLEDIMKTLWRWYDFEYEFANDSVRNIHFEGGLNRYENIIPVLEIMQSTGRIKYKINGKKITFM
ncbi:FecR family protein [Labilibacter sediminis]|nr:FecR family protein [Labilibacter sediminis]